MLGAALLGAGTNAYAGAYQCASLFGDAAPPVVPTTFILRTPPLESAQALRTLELLDPARLGDADFQSFAREMIQLSIDWNPNRRIDPEKLASLINGPREKSEARLRFLRNALKSRAALESTYRNVELAYNQLSEQIAKAQGTRAKARIAEARKKQRELLNGFLDQVSAFFRQVGIEHEIRTKENGERFLVLTPSHRGETLLSSLAFTSKSKLEGLEFRYDPHFVMDPANGVLAQYEDSGHLFYLPHTAVLDPNRTDGVVIHEVSHAVIAVFIKRRLSSIYYGEVRPLKSKLGRSELIEGYDEYMSYDELRGHLIQALQARNVARETEAGEVAGDVAAAREEAEWPRERAMKMAELILELHSLTLDALKSNPLRTSDFHIESGVTWVDVQVGRRPLGEFKVSFPLVRSQGPSDPANPELLRGQILSSTPGIRDALRFLENLR